MEQPARNTKVYLLGIINLLSDDLPRTRFAAASQKPGLALGLAGWPCAEGTHKSAPTNRVDPVAMRALILANMVLSMEIKSDKQSAGCDAASAALTGARFSLGLWDK